MYLKLGKGEEWIQIPVVLATGSLGKVTQLKVLKPKLRPSEAKRNFAETLKSSSFKVSLMSMLMCWRVDACQVVCNLFCSIFIGNIIRRSIEANKFRATLIVNLVLYLEPPEVRGVQMLAQ